jgi:hypothetical protein
MKLATYPLGKTGKIQWWTARIDIPSSLGLPLQLRKVDRSTAIEVLLAGNTVLLTGAQVDEFWRMVGKQDSGNVLASSGSFLSSLTSSDPGTGRHDLPRIN